MFPITAGMLTHCYDAVSLTTVAVEAQFSFVNQGIHSNVSNEKQEGLLLHNTNHVSLMRAGAGEKTAKGSLSTSLSSLISLHQKQHELINGNSLLGVTRTGLPQRNMINDREKKAQRPAAQESNQANLKRFQKNNLSTSTTV